MRALVLGDEEARDLPLHRRSHKNGSRFGEGLDARGDVRRLAEHLAGRVDQDRAGVEADARGELGRAGSPVAGVKISERALDSERGAQRPLCVVLLGRRVAEERHQPVAEFFQHMAAKPRHGGGGFVEIVVDEVAPVLRVELRHEAR